MQSFFSKNKFLFISIAIIFSACAGGKKAATLSGNEAFERKQYLVAAKTLQEELKTESNKDIKNDKTLKVAQAYEFANKQKEAAEWYKKVYEQNNQASFFYKYISTLKATDDFEKCITELNELVRKFPDEKNAAEKEIKLCNQAKDWVAAGSRYRVYKIDSVNTFRNEYATVQYEKDKLIFTSDRQASTGDEKYGWTGEKFTDFYTAKFEYKNNNVKFDRPKKFTDAINTATHEGTCTFNKNFTEIIFARTVRRKVDEDDFSQLFISKRTAGGDWETPEQLHFFADDTMQNVGQPFLTEDGKSLYFSSDAAGGYGGKDLYVSNRTADGWGAAKNLGSVVNTTGDEVFPYLRNDGQLFFSSNGFDGMGGLDIFMAQKNGWKFSRPINVQSPINTGGDDFGIFFTDYKNSNLPDSLMGRGFLSSTRVGGKGGDDIYRFELRQEFTYRMEGIVKENNTNEVVPHAIVQLYEIVNTLPYIEATDTADGDGKFSFKVEKNKDYKVSVTAKDHFAKSELTSTKKLPPQSDPLVVVKRNVSLEKIVKNKMIEIPNIFYDLAKADVRPDAAAVLDSLVLPVMNENPTLKFELGSHTDSQGNDDYNQKLSQQRADAVVQYLISKGIAEERLVAKGYGETQIINRCKNGVKCEDSEHQQNRRTTFKVLEN